MIPKFLTIAASCLLAAGAAAQTPSCLPPPGRCLVSADPVAAFLPLWAGLPDRTGWQMHVSPGFPRDWPLPAPGQAAVVRYAFAMRFRPGLADGVEMAAPWARSIQSADGIAVELLPAGLRPLGIQGVRPLRSDEAALAGREQEVADRLLIGGAPAADGVVRAFTCNWIGRQGVVAATITPLHPGFTQWLACP